VRRIRLTRAEIEALWAAARNIDPCMFEEMPEPEGDRMFKAWESGLEKLGRMLDRHEGK
jgi:hypothetical protein